MARAPTWIGTVPIGYADGVRRALTNDCDVLVGGRRVPLVGTVSMDNITVDLGPEPPPRGAEVVLIGAQGGERVLAEEWARRLATINYEITCGISARVPREHHPGSGAVTPAAPLEAVRESRRARGVDRRRRRPRPAARPRRRPTSTSRSPRTPRRRRARSPAPTGGAAFRLSGAFGAWRVVGPEHAWHVDLVVLRDGDIDADLAARDFTVNAMAEPLAGGELLDPHGGRADLEARRLRMVRPEALADDPLRTLRAVRLAVDLGLTIEPETAAAIGREAPGLERVAAERIFGELKQVIRSPAVRTGLQLMDAHGITAQVLPELRRAARRGAERVPPPRRPRPHARGARPGRRDRARPAGRAGLGEHAGAVAALLREPLADELTRGDAMRIAALLHDAAKPWTRIDRARRALRLPRPRPRGRRARAHRAAAPARVGEARRARRRALPAPPAARLPRPRGAAGPARACGATCGRPSPTPSR